MTFRGDSWKVTKGAIVVYRGQKEGTLYLTGKINGSIVITETSVNKDM